MYGLNLSLPRHQKHPLRRRFGRKDDVAVAAPMDPMMDPMAAVDPAADSTVVTVVEAVAPVEPQKRRYRATVTRTITETATVEFDAFDNVDTQTLAEELIMQIPADQWIDNQTDSWGYIDKIEEVGEASDAVVALEDDPALEPTEGEETEPEAVARRYRNLRRRRLSRKALAADVTATLASLQTEIDGLFAVEAVTVEEIDAQIAALAEIRDVDLAGLVVDPDEADPASVDAAAAAIDSMRMLIDETIATLDAEAAALATPAPAVDPLLADPALEV